MKLCYNNTLFGVGHALFMGSDAGQFGIFVLIFKFATQISFLWKRLKTSFGEREKNLIFIYVFYPFFQFDRFVKQYVQYLFFY